MAWEFIFTWSFLTLCSICFLILLSTVPIEDGHSLFLMAFQRFEGSCRVTSSKKEYHRI